MTTVVRAVAALGLVLAARLLFGAKSREEAVRAPIVRLVVEHPWLSSGAMAIGVVTLVAVVVTSGIVPIKASSGHWWITEQLLDFAKTRSVATYSWALDAPAIPELEDEALVLRGAGHYEGVCVGCHGGPRRNVPPAVATMTPPPPSLADRLRRWTPEELFTIVKHGIKFTGMPAWPVAQRDDEVWAMVAFLRRLPQLDAAGFRQLVYGDIEGAIEPTTSAGDPCWRCHGPDGTGRGAGAFPSLAGQRAEYLYASMRAYADRSRSSGTMTVIAAAMDDEAMRAAAAYYASLRPRHGERSGEPAAAARGEAIASRGIPERDVPPCAECHGPTDQPKNPAYPRLSGQHVRYLSEQLHLLQQRRRGGSPNAALMHVFVDRLTPDDIRDVTQYYASEAALPSAPR